MRVLVTGGYGYMGSVLVPRLLRAGHEVIVLDQQWFGKHIPDHANMTEILADTRELKYLPKPIDAIIHLAAIANDPCGELDARLTWEVNVLATLRLAEMAVRDGIRQFIFASSASVYGIKDDRAVVETDSLEPVSDYNKTKMVGERVLASFADKLALQIVRPATLCGYSPRMRGDIVVNLLTMRALKDGVMRLMTPELSRPHCHVQDCAALYLYLLDRPHLTGIFNAGFENQTIRQTARMISARLGVPIEEGASSMDKRSYRVDSSKVLGVGFKPQYTVAMAIEEMADMWRSGALREEERHYNLAWMRKQGLVRT